MFLLIDLAFFGANLLKIREGGWIPLVLGVLIFLLMTTWRRGIEAIGRTMHAEAGNHQRVSRPNEGAERSPVCRAPPCSSAAAKRAIPSVLVRHVAQIKALQETVVSLTVRFEEYPRVPMAERAEVEQIADGFWHVTIRFGFVGDAKRGRGFGLRSRRRAARSIWMTRSISRHMTTSCAVPILRGLPHGGECCSR